MDVEEAIPFSGALTNVQGQNSKIESLIIQLSTKDIFELQTFLDLH